MHEAALAALGIEGRYLARRVDRAGLEAAAAELRRGELDGANITMPHKARAAELADDLTATAARAGSVNTWVARRGRILGDTTDVPGLTTAAERCGLPAEGPVLVLGAGGAAAAALVAFAGRPLALVARRPEAAVELARRVGVEATVLRWGEAVEAVVVNATPLGMAGESLPPGLVESATGLVDMAYGPTATPAVRAALGRGIPVVDGIAMLAAQAEVAFRLWTGRDAPVGLMEAVARKASRGASTPPKLGGRPEV